MHDYVQLYFQDDILTIFNGMTLQQGEARLRTGEPGFCDALVRLIGASAVRSNGELEQSLQMWFSSGDVLVVDAAAPGTSSADAWMYGPVDGPWAVKS